MTLFDQRPIRPMLSTPGEPFDSDEYLFEPKWDGLRAILYVQNGRLEIQNRNLRDVTQGFPELQQLSGTLDAKAVILDGEIVVLNKKGLPSFQFLQPRFGVTDTREAKTLAKTTPSTYVAFDLLHLNGKDVINHPVEERKRLLKSILTDGPYLL
ncbi:MAG TPA: hypothetical protein VE177_01945, partial [Candidatus Binatus sp.]|nr:hypothetical protein [Candidatus Binatus sp.]